MLSFTKKKMSPTATRSLHVASTPNLPDENMPTPEFEQPNDGTFFSKYKKVFIGVSALAIVGTVAALALYHPNAHSGTGASVGQAEKSNDVVANTDVSQIDVSNVAAQPVDTAERPSLEKELILLKARHDYQVSHNDKLTGELKAAFNNAHSDSIAQVATDATTDSTEAEKPSLEKELILLKARHEAQAARQDKLTGELKAALNNANTDSIAQVSTDATTESTEAEKPSLEKDLILVKARHEVQAAHQDKLTDELKAALNNANTDSVAEISTDATSESVATEAEKPSLEKELILLKARHDAQANTAVETDASTPLRVSYIRAAPSQTTDGVADITTESVEVEKPSLEKELILLKARHDAQAAHQDKLTGELKAALNNANTDSVAEISTDATTESVTTEAEKPSLDKELILLKARHDAQANSAVEADASTPLHVSYIRSAPSQTTDNVAEVGETTTTEELTPLRVSYIRSAPAKKHVSYIRSSPSSVESISSPVTEEQRPLLEKYLELLAAKEGAESSP
ncbi:hypothetical protein Ae201684P_004416 [Aphanomyces euteiches]|nr:hypothetical protein Ae201684P_004416 [Aphanomyces euteiches]